MFFTWMLRMLRYMLMMMAMATAVSAAEMPMANRLKKNPSNCPGNRKRLNTEKLMSTEFYISSTEMRMASKLRRVKKPYIPTNIMIVDTIKYNSICTML